MIVPRLMGILNVTPDSFSDGGLHSRLEDALARAERLVEEGADLIDVGGESTRPGADDVNADTQIQRVCPVVRALVSRGIPVSVDTRLSKVARVACDAGATLVNDMSALSDPGMVRVLEEFGVDVCLGHMQGTPKTMQVSPHYESVVDEVRLNLLDAASEAKKAGLAREQIYLDPGFGFGKTFDHNLELFRHLKDFVDTGFPVLIGISRKGFVGQLMEGASMGERELGNLVLHLLAGQQGVRCIRTHEVKATRDALKILSNIWT